MGLARETAGRGSMAVYTQVHNCNSLALGVLNAKLF